MLACAVLFLARAALAAPGARILRVEPEARPDGDAAVVTLLVDLAEPRPVTGAIGRCGEPSNDAGFLACAANALEQPNATFSPVPWPPNEAASGDDIQRERASTLFAVTIDGADVVGELSKRTRWSAAADSNARAGTAFLILVDASNTMGDRLQHAKGVARGLLEKRSKNDRFNLKWFNDVGWSAGTGWTSDDKTIETALDGITKAASAPGRARPLFDLMKNATLEGFGELGAAGADVPMHAALVVISDGWAGTDFGGSPPALAGEFGRMLAGGVFDERNATLPRMPIPTISVWLPASGIEEASENARQFMQNLAVPSVGGAYFIVPDGKASRPGRIADAVRKRFDEMQIVEFRVPCLAPSLNQTIKLGFRDTPKPIAGDAWRDVPLFADPRKWPLDVHIEETVKKTERDPLVPGGTVTILGRFCWGNAPQRAELYLVPKNQELPESTEGQTMAEAEQARDDLTAQGYRGTPLRSGDNYVEFQLPDSEKLFTGKPEDVEMKLIVVDGATKRTSPATQGTAITVKTKKKASSPLVPGAIAYGAVVLLLLLVTALRGGGNRRRQSVLPAKPVAAPAISSGTSDRSSLPVSSAPASPAPAPTPSAPAGQGPAPAAAPDAPIPKATVFAAAPLFPTKPKAARAILRSATGAFTVMPGRELRIGRGPTGCDIPLGEPRVSASHATVKIENGEFYLRDEGSNNGTSVNGARLQAHVWVPVAHGSSVRLGPIELSVQLEA